jgi:acetyl esterase/lipase
VAWLVPVLVDAGYVVASVAHRLSHHAPFPAQLQDVKAALRWLRANAGRYGLDPERVGAWGESSGGHLVALLATTAGAAELEGELPAGAPDTRIRAAAVWYGPTDFLQMDAHRLPGGMLHDTPDSPESRLLAARISEVPERVRQANPVTWVSAAAPPFLLVHGDRDLLVPHHQSVLLRDALAAAGVPVTLRTLPGAGHGTAEFRTLEAARELVDFFGRHLAPGGR